MLPVLLDLGFFKIYTQGIFLVLAFFWSSFMLWKHVTLTSYKEEDVFDVIFMSLFGGLLIGRIVHVALNFKDFGFDILKFLLINGYPGIHGIGAVLGFLLSLSIFAFWKKMDLKKFIDYLVSPMLLAIAIAKIGSFFSGSAVGTQTKFFLALKYPALDGTRHLTALYESALFFIGSYLAHRILMQIRREKLFNGFNFFFFLWYFGLVMTVFDPITTFRTKVAGISFDLMVSGVLLLTVSIYFVYYFRKFIVKNISLTRLLPNKSHKS
jgi:prolipoprotein diacylglyceryltransferase